MERELVIGYYGNGKSTNRYHLPFLIRRKGKIRVKTIYARTLREDWPRWPGAEYTSDPRVLLDDPEIDVVVVTTPAGAHFEAAKAVLEAGKNCVLEKPFAQSAQEARNLFAHAHEKGLMLQCYQNRRFDSDFLTAQRVIESGVLGDLQEVEMHYDYYRPEIPEKIDWFSRRESYLYNHACHTLDQVLSYFGKPERVVYDVRQLLGEGRMNDYFDLDLFYGRVKVSVKSSYFRVKERPSFVLYGSRGMFVKQEKDRQEADLKKFYLPDRADFGLDLPEHYGTLTYYDTEGRYHEEKVPSEVGDYGRYYDALYETLVHGAPQLVTEEQTLLQMDLLEEGIRGLR